MGSKHAPLHPQKMSHAGRIGFERSALAGVIYDDVPQALARWHALGIKVYMFSSSSREADQFILANTNWGDLRKYFCCFFSTSMGSKKDSHSYTEIVRTVGIDRPRDMLFVTSNVQEAEAAKAAGLEVMITVRPGNGPLPENQEFCTIVFVGKA